MNNTMFDEFGKSGKNLHNIFKCNFFLESLIFLQQIVKSPFVG